MIHELYVINILFGTHVDGPELPSRACHLVELNDFGRTITVIWEYDGEE